MSTIFGTGLGCFSLWRCTNIPYTNCTTHTITVLLLTVVLRATIGVVRARASNPPHQTLTIPCRVKHVSRVLLTISNVFVMHFFALNHYDDSCCCCCCCGLMLVNLRWGSVASLRRTYEIPQRAIVAFRGADARARHLSYLEITQTHIQVYILYIIQNTARTERITHATQTQGS